MKGLLTLDLAGRLGFCRWNPGASPYIGTYLLPEPVDKCYGRRNSTFRQWLIKTIQTHEIELVVYEENIIIPKRDNLNRLKLAIGLTMITEEVCFSQNISCSTAAISQWRKHYLGSGGYSTEQAKEYCMNKAQAAGFKPQHHDAAEALGIMDFTADMLKIQKDWPDSNIFGNILFDPRKKAK